MFENIKEHSQDNFQSGADKVRIKDLERKLNIKLPKEYKRFLEEINYAELFGDPFYGFHNQMPEIDIYTKNHQKEHLQYGFLEIFNNDIDGTVYIRLDNGKVYIDFIEPVAESISDFIDKLLSEG